MSRPPILVPHASGTNRDVEAAQAIELAGGDPRIVHVNELASGDVRFCDHAGVLLPGGFSYGDALGAGARLALELRLWFGDELAEVVRAGRPMLGICNGFQALVKAGILAGPAGPDSSRSVTLTDNASGRFECRWVTLRADPACRSAWVAGLDELIHCPVAHGEGRLAVRDEAVVKTLAGDGLVAFRYTTEGGAEAAGEYPANPNGSVADVAGLADPTGAVVGLMPHPEDHVVDWQRPTGGPGRSGLRLFEAFVAAAR